ncbi:MAG: hypothetical protein IJ593_01710 [Lachnospiraceae bacterium]|nr:hypothetical protein [Lachnospiraceae bacterium]
MNKEEFTIKYSDSYTSNDIIYDLMNIEKDVYEEKDRGQFDSIEKRFNKNKYEKVIYICNVRHSWSV